tara:strand:+ start:30018 stop:30167 length:150 start_codon:yes stop_codon:yes gene_type:complete
MLTYILIASASALVGGGIVAWRLRGDRSLMETGKAVILGGGGPGPRQPK